MRRAVLFRIEGRVQGVGYRWWAVGQARRLGLAGWVRNRAEGWVELLAIGEADVIEDLARLCADGPSGARVTAVAQATAQDDGSEGFEERASV